MTTFPEWVETRPIEKADAAEWADLLNEAQVADQNGEYWNADDLIEEIGDPRLNPGRDTIGLWSGGRMLAFGIVHWRKNVIDVDRLNTDAAVRPAWRRHGLGRALMTWMIGRARELHEEHHPEVADVELNAGATSTNLGAQVLFTSLGYQPARYLFELKRSFEDSLPAVEVPDGLRLVPFDPAYDEALRLTHNDVFQDHWGSAPKDEETWKMRFTGARAFRAGLSFLLLDGDRIVSYANGFEYEADTAMTGIREVYLGQVGTVALYRGRGLATVVLTALMWQAEQSGFERITLGVDSGNSTGALGLYERLGFQRAKTSITYSLPLG